MTFWTSQAFKNPALVATHYGMEQALEVSARTTRLVDKVVPWDISKPSMVKHRTAAARIIRSRIAERVKRRDANLLPIEMAERIETHWGQKWSLA